MNFSELPDKAKQRAREQYLEGGIPYDWWDDTYENAVRMGALLGIKVDTRSYRSVGGKTMMQPDIHFSGFASQGDGACFVGNYHYAPDAIDKVKAETGDERLLSLATDLTTLQISQRLLGRGLVYAHIRNGRSNYCHSQTMDIDVVQEDVDDDGLMPDTALKELIRSFANWIYSQLEAESDYLHSDEYVDERLADEDFDETGETV